MPKSLSELKSIFKSKKEEYLKLKAQNTPEALEQEARSLLKLLFEKYKAGGLFLKETQKEARATCEIASPNGRVRHLWGYLHFSPSIHAASNRQAPNSIVQGFSSDEGFEANRLLDKMCWFFFKRKGQPFSLKTVGSTHDSSESVAHAIEMPIAAYLAEHAFTTQCAKRYRQVYGIEFNVGLEIEMNFGPTLAHIGINDLGSDLLTAEGKKALEAWDFRAENLMRLIEASLIWSRDNLHYDVDIDAILKKAEHNNNIIADLRRKEIRYSYDRKEAVSEKMLMNSENSLDLGLVFEKPFKDKWGRE